MLAIAILAIDIEIENSQFVVSSIVGVEYECFPMLTIFCLLHYVTDAHPCSGPLCDVVTPSLRQWRRSQVKSGDKY